MNRLVESWIGALLAGELSGNMQMPTNPRYQPAEAKPFFGYDQWAKWLGVVELAWISCLIEIGYIKNFELTFEYGKSLLASLNTTRQDQVEKEVGGHDILALVKMIGDQLPPEVRWAVHHGLTSYDTIDTARALMNWNFYQKAFKPKLQELDQLWRSKIEAHVSTLQVGRTHLQHALPITAGFWLSQVHARFANSVIRLDSSAKQLTGKLSGAVGSHASFEALGLERVYKEYCQSQQSENSLPATLEGFFLNEMLGLPGQPQVSTQIVQPEIFGDFASRLVLLSSAFCQLGDDCRILQSSDIGELSSVSSTSSTMAHKKGNPIAAENLSGMYTTVAAEFMKVLQNMSSNLQRDLRNSSPARDYPAVLIYVFQQVKTAIRLFNKLDVDGKACAGNFKKSGRLLMGELLYLLLSRAGLTNAHEFVNKKAAPRAVGKHQNFVVVMDYLARQDGQVAAVWSAIEADDKSLLAEPELYLGRAREIAQQESMVPLSISI